MCFLQISSHGHTCLPSPSSAAAAFSFEPKAVRVRKTLPALGIAIEGGADTAMARQQQQQQQQQQAPRQQPMAPKQQQQQPAKQQQPLKQPLLPQAPPPPQAFNLASLPRIIAVQPFGAAFQVLFCSRPYY